MNFFLFEINWILFNSFSDQNPEAMKFLFGVCIFVSFTLCFIQLLPIDIEEVQVKPQDRFIKNLTRLLQNTTFDEIERFKEVNETVVPKCLNVECPLPNCFWIEANIKGKCMMCACAPPPLI
jgi:hypothetical protein